MNIMNGNARGCLLYDVEAFSRRGLRENIKKVYEKCAYYSAGTAKSAAFRAERTVRRFSYKIYILISGSLNDIVVTECFAGAEASAPIKHSRIKETCEGVLKSQRGIVVGDINIWRDDKSNKAINSYLLCIEMGRVLYAMCEF